MSERNIIAVLGSASEGLARDYGYEPEIKDFERVKQAAKEIGREIADKGWDLQVFSLHPDFIERDVVDGYASADSGEGSVRTVYIHYSISGTGTKDPMIASREAYDQCRFEGIPSPHDKWEVSFYRSLSSANAVILIGGGKSTLATGVVALAQRIPVYAVATFGGSSQTVWKAIEVGTDLPSDEHRRWMGRSWTTESSASLCIKALEEQMNTRVQEKNADFEKEEERRRAEVERKEKQERIAQEQAARADKAKALVLYALSSITSLAVTIL
jgi:hypothetical protein